MEETEHELEIQLENRKNIMTAMVKEKSQLEGRIKILAIAVFLDTIWFVYVMAKLLSDHKSSINKYRWGTIDAFSFGVTSNPIAYCCPII